MPFPHIGEIKYKKESYSSWYFLAVIIGVGIFIFFLIFTKALIFIVKLAMKHGIYFIVGVLILLILIKKLKKHKRMKEFKRNEYRYR